MLASRVIMYSINGDKRNYKSEIIDQRDRISKLFHSCVQTSRYKRGKLEKGKLTNKNKT